jgi:hypothetical protein
MKKEDCRVLCTRCLEEENAEWVVPGNFVVVVLLFLVTLPLLCIPALLFLAWQVTAKPEHWACRVCHSKEIVPVGSTRAQMLRAEAEQAGALRT